MRKSDSITRSGLVALVLAIDQVSVGGVLEVPKDHSFHSL